MAQAILSTNVHWVAIESKTSRERNGHDEVTPKNH